MNEEKKWNKIKKEKNKNYSTKIKLNAKEKNSKKKKERNHINKKQNLRYVNPLSFNKNIYFIVSLFYLKSKSEDSESK